MAALTTFAQTLARTATKQYNSFRCVNEGKSPLKEQIKLYWTEIGEPFPGIGTAWSAVFVSWCLKKAGATAAEFRFNPQHSVFVHWAIQNATTGTGLFRGQKITEYAPQIGDIIHNNRGGSTFDFEFARTHSNYSSHSALVIELGKDADGNFAATVGGNESDSVARKVIRLSPDGLIVQRTTDPFISIIRNMK